MMIEKVARAAHDAMMADRFDDLSENCIDREIWRNVAKAAIEAIANDVFLAITEYDPYSYIWMAEEIRDKMIDAALKEE